MGKTISDIKIIFCGMMLCGICAFLPARAAEVPVAVKITSVEVDKSNKSLLTKVTIDASDLKLKSNEEVLVEPQLDFGDGMTIDLTPILFVGHNRRIQAERHPARHDGELLSDAGTTIELQQVFPLDERMKGGDSRAMVTRRGCCSKGEREMIEGIGFRFPEPKVFSPKYRFITPEAEGEKTRNLTGKAYIDFRVNRTEIDPSYRKNPRELSAIYATIDSVKNDDDVELKKMTFIGYASPEGSYSNNERLARERAASLTAYVKKLYAFPDNIVSSSYVPEDWEGLEAAVIESDYANKEGILAIIRDKSMKPDAREKRLASKYPAEYKELLRDVYPGLRHSDYTIEYTVKSYDDPEEILRLLETAPQKLSLREMFVAAGTLEPGSETYCRVFETAARMYPESKIANLNAAISELQGGRYERARYFLDRAGDSAEAVYTRGLLAAFEKRYEDAENLLKKAQEMGITEAGEALDSLRERL